LNDNLTDYEIFDKIVEAEIAMAKVNRARAMLYARIYEIEATQPDEAEGLRQKAHELHDILREIRVYDDEGVKAVTEHWGRLTKDEAAFWAAMNG
jgi:hypothetical protein